MCTYAYIYTFYLKHKEFVAHIFQYSYVNSIDSISSHKYFFSFIYIFAKLLYVQQLVATDELMLGHTWMLLDIFYIHKMEAK